MPNFSPLAASRGRYLIRSSLTSQATLFQLFHPIGGVRCDPQGKAPGPSFGSIRTLYIALRSLPGWLPPLAGDFFYLLQVVPIVAAHGFQDGFECHVASLGMINGLRQVRGVERPH